MGLLHVGFEGSVSTERVLVITTVESAPIQRAVRQAQADGQLIDLTYGRRRHSVIFLDTGHVVLSALRPEQLVKKWKTVKG